MVYCVVPSDMAGRSKRSVERALRDLSDVTFLVERRGRDRRVGGERRVFRADVDPRSERRRVGYPDGRRVAERRAVLVPVAEPPALRGASHARFAETAFLAPLEVPTDFRDDVDTVRAIIRYKLGRSDFTELYDRWFGPLYTYLNVTLDRGADVELHVSTTLADALHELSHATPGPTEVRGWLFGLAHRAARPRAFETARPLAAAKADADEEAELDLSTDSLAWLTDDDLLLLVRRRPAAERHVLVLRYFGGLALAEIAAVMGVEPRAADALHRSAVASLDATLAGVSHGGRSQERHFMGRLIHQTPALRQRRRALLAV